MLIALVFFTFTLIMPDKRQKSNIHMASLGFKLTIDLLSPKPGSSPLLYTGFWCFRLYNFVCTAHYDFTQSSKPTKEFILVF